MSLGSLVIWVDGSVVIWVDGSVLMFRGNEHSNVFKLCLVGSFVGFITNPLAVCKAGNVVFSYSFGMFALLWAGWRLHRLRRLHGLHGLHGPIQGHCPTRTSCKCSSPRSQSERTGCSAQEAAACQSEEQVLRVQLCRTEPRVFAVAWEMGTYFL